MASIRGSSMQARIAEPVKTWVEAPTIRISPWSFALQSASSVPSRRWKSSAERMPCSMTEST